MQKSSLSIFRKNSQENKYMEYTISVIVLIYNVEKYIDKCLHSLFNQTLRNIEFIFINDATPDNSMTTLNAAIQEKYPSISTQIKILTNKNNRGTAYCRNLGIKNARGKYIIFCDSDDWVETNIYQTLYEKAERNKSEIVICDFWKEFPKHRQIYSKDISIDTYTAINNILSGQLTSYTWNQLVLKELYIKNKIEFPIGINMWEDLVITIKLYYYAKRISYVSQPLYHYNLCNINSVVHTINNKQFNDMITACNSIEYFLKKKNVYKSYYVAFMKRVFFAKKCLLMNSQIRDYQKWKKLYPQSNNLINQYGLRFYHRWGYLLALKEKYKCAILILTISDWMDNLLKKILLRG